jgi:hypothetical protein
VRTSRFIGLVAAFVLALPVVALANGERADQYKVTGGGQVIASTGEAGPGDTVGFVAISTDDDDGARGWFQAVGTSEAGREMVIFGGEVTCLEGNGSTARFGGYERGTGQAFTVDVVDNAEGGDYDIVYFQTSDDPCEDGNPVFEEDTLARGNLTIHNGN